ncbi:MAG: leucyl aminopeptidase family protein [Acidobacteriota bacterium]|nr:MAG: leucyl aminopeptidase family protein [Acidobacteriota bacterium]
MPVRISSRKPPQGAARIVVEGQRLPRSLEEEVRRQWALGPVASLATLERLPAPMLFAVKAPRWDVPLEIRRRFGRLGRKLRQQKITRAALELPRSLAPHTADAIVVGLSSGLYGFDRYKTGPRVAPPVVQIVPPNAAWGRAARSGLALAEAVTLARDLVNTPAEDLGPEELEKEARRVARDGGLKIRVLDRQRCARMGMGALLAVGRASTRAPRLIVLEHRGAPRSRECLALVGKGIVFDTGGLNLKSAAGMLLMKKDMGGAAIVLAAAQAVAAQKLKRNVRFYLAVAENAVAGNALRPGDVIRALNGTTIEIGNTDAEGRLVLADAVSLAVREKATRIVDAATLTGAALIALGRLRVPLMGSDERLLADIERAAEQTGERVWRLPADAEYAEALKGKVADLKNIGKGGEAGVITGGLFIGHFAGKVPWAHLDISPASWADGGHDLGPEGATGVMVTTLARLAAGVSPRTA